ncbi:MAG: CopD family protein [Chloroflexi bacterium]|nr:CopD family protein [Chloroflexota bacterium]
MVWVGGMLFLALVIVPATRHLPTAERGALFDLVGRRFRLVGWSAIALLVVTGVLNATFRGVTWESVASGQLLGSEFGRLLAAKLGLVAAMLGLSAVHDFVVGPASTRALQRATPEAIREAEALRRQASWIARVESLLALLVVALAVTLVRGLPR